MLPSLDIVLILVSTFTFALYCITVKKIKAEPFLIFLFWIHTFTYIGYFSVYLFRRFVLEHDTFAIEQLIHEFTFINAPLYIIMGLNFLGSFLIFNRLIVNYPISQIMPFAQISLLFTVIGYMILGDPYSASSMTGALVVCLGALIAAVDSFSFPNILEPYRKLPRGLWVGILCEAALLSSSALITFLLTQRTGMDKMVMRSLKHMFPFSFHNPFYFNLGARFFIMMTFLIYISYQKNYRTNIFSALRKNLLSILLVSFVYFISSYTYQEAYRLTVDKDIIAALSKLSVPMVILLAFFFLNEKLNANKIVGSVLIVVGGAIALLF